MAISTSQQSTIQKICFSIPHTISQLAEKLKIGTKRAAMELYNFFSTKKAHKLFFIEKKDGFVWIRTNPAFFSQHSLDLILSKQKSSETKINNGRQYKKLEGLKRAGPERLEAALKLNRIKEFGYYNTEKKEFVTTSPIRQEIDGLFQDYCARVKQEKIILTQKTHRVFSQDIAIPYQTRFTSPARQKDNLDRFRYAFNQASRSHLKGVFLTLTALPRGSLWETNQATRAAWVKFKKNFFYEVLPKNAKWIKVNEFQQSGRLHFHIAIFGVNWLALKSVIQRAWLRAGGGYIIDVHTIQNTPSGWVWTRSKPSDAGRNKPRDLLQAYLEKSMSQDHGAMYWAMGVQNWTCSKNLHPPQEHPAKTQERRTAGYVLKGVLNRLRGFRAANRQDSRAFYSATKSNTHTQKQETQKKPYSQKLDLTFRTASNLSYQC